MSRFTRFVAIDWSGAKGPHQPGIAVAACGPGGEAPCLVTPPDGIWSRGAVLDWLLTLRGQDALIGLDLSIALPFADRGGYFPEWAESPQDMRALWAVVDRLAKGEPNYAVSGVPAHSDLARHFRVPGRCGDLFEAGRGRLRVTERRALAMGLSPSSTFNLIGAAQVGKSSLTGMRVLHALRNRVPLWPLDAIPAKGPLLVEIYTTIAARAAGLRAGLSKLRASDALDQALAMLGSGPHWPMTRYSDHATDALITAAWLRAHAGDAALWHPAGLTPSLARTEGWTFGVA